MFFAMSNLLTINSPKKLIKQISVSDEKIELKDVYITFPLTKEFFLQISRTESKKQNLTINKRLILDNVKLESLELSKIEFTKSFVIRNSKIKTIWVNGCIFDEHFCIFDNDDAIIESVELLNSTFNNDVNLEFSPKHKINNIEILTSDFKTNLQISGALIGRKDNGEEGIHIGEKTRIGDTLIIEDSTILGEILLSCEIGENLQLSNINHQIVRKLSKECVSCNFYIKSSNINGVFYIDKCAFDTIEILWSTIHDFSEQDFYYTILLGDAARIFYSSPTIMSDPVKCNKYRAELYERKLKDNIKESIENIISKIDGNSEENKHFKEVKHLITKKQSVWKRLLKNIWMFLLSFITSLNSGEKFILFLNKYSNDFNRSWFRGIIFTNIVAIIFFFLINYLGTDIQFFVINWTFDGFGEVLKDYIKLLDFFNLSTIEDNNAWISLTPVGVILLFVARIFIAYGCWQTIYAFYKYSK